jgi:hypothetical protein
MYVHELRRRVTQTLNMPSKQRPRLSFHGARTLKLKGGSVACSLCRYKCGDEKGLLLEGLIRKYQPLTVVELGSFLGYSATRIGSRLPKVRAQECGPGVVDRPTKIALASQCSHKSPLWPASGHEQKKSATTALEHRSQH